MKRIAYLAVILAISFATGCSKIEIKEKFLEESMWTGTLSHSDADSDEFDSISFEFHKGYSDFSYLEYGSNVTEDGKALYTVSENEITFSKANDLIDGTWIVTEKKGSELVMERQHKTKLLTIELIKRR